MSRICKSIEIESRIMAAGDDEGGWEMTVNGHRVSSRCDKNVLELGVMVMVKDWCRGLPMFYLLWLYWKPPNCILKRVNCMACEFYFNSKKSIDIDQHWDVIKFKFWKTDNNLGIKYPAPIGGKKTRVASDTGTLNVDAQKKGAKLTVLN